MATVLNQPEVLSQPFAENGDKNTIPVTNDGTTGEASQSLGFPAICSQPVPPNGNGIPPSRADFNGIFNLLSGQFFYLQNGGKFTFNQDVSNAIGGYPQGAILTYTNNNISYEVVSLIANNTYNFVTNPEYIDGVKWKRALSQEVALLESIYPVGSIYIGTQSTCPLTSLIPGSTWTLVASNKALWTGDGTNGNTTINAGLPNITGYWRDDEAREMSHSSGCFYAEEVSGKRGDFTGSSTVTKALNHGFDASRSSLIYGNSATVQPPAYVVNVWRRTA